MPSYKITYQHHWLCKCKLRYQQRLGGCIDTGCNWLLTDWRFHPLPRSTLVYTCRDFVPATCHCACVLQHVPSCIHTLKLFYSAVSKIKLHSKPSSSKQCLSLLYEVVVDIHWSKNGQGTNQRPNLFTDTIQQKVIAPFLTHHGSNCNFDVRYNNNSTDTDHNLLKEWKYFMCK